MKKTVLVALVTLFLVTACTQESSDDQNQTGSAKSSSTGNTFTVGWSHYVGWEPWAYADESGILSKWADNEGVNIQLKLVENYRESLDLYNSGDVQAVSVRNIDAISNAATGGVDSQAIIILDSSRGNDGIVMRNGNSVAALKGRAVNLVEHSVSHYLLARALEINGLSESDVRIVNTNDSDIAAIFLSQGQGVAATWNPLLLKALDAPGSKLVFDSSEIPGEIFSMLVVNADAPETVKRALSGAWYETMALIESGDQNALEFIAESSGSSLVELNKQLATTSMYYSPERAAEFASSKAIKTTANKVRTFLFERGLYGSDATSVDHIGIEFPDGTALGDTGNLKLRFTNQYMPASN